MSYRTYMHAWYRSEDSGLTSCVMAPACQLNPPPSPPPTHTPCGDKHLRKQPLDPASLSFQLRRRSVTLHCTFIIVPPSRETAKTHVAYMYTQHWNIIQGGEPTPHCPPRLIIPSINTIPSPVLSSLFILLHSSLIFFAVFPRAALPSLSLPH